MDNSRSEQQAGFNVSYENSFTAIKRDIMRKPLIRKTQVVSNQSLVRDYSREGDRPQHHSLQEHFNIQDTH
jgi:hypothetical protein